MIRLKYMHRKWVLWYTVQRNVVCHFFQDLVHRNTRFLTVNLRAKSSKSRIVYGPKSLRLRLIQRLLNLQRIFKFAWKDPMLLTASSWQRLRTNFVPWEGWLILFIMNYTIQPWYNGRHFLLAQSKVPFIWRKFVLPPTRIRWKRARKLKSATFQTHVS